MLVKEQKYVLDTFVDDNFDVLKDIIFLSEKHLPGILKETLEDFGRVNYDEVDHYVRAAVAKELFGSEVCSNPGASESERIDVETGEEVQDREAEFADIFDAMRIYIAEQTGVDPCDPRIDDAIAQVIQQEMGPKVIERMVNA